MGDLSQNNEFEKNAEEYNRQLLKQTAITFSLEGVSKDLKYFIQKKVTHNRVALSYLTRILDLTINSGSKVVRDSVLKKGSVTQKMLEHVVGEIINTDIILNDALKSIIENTKSLNEQKNRR